MDFVNLTDLAAELLTVSAITKVTVDLLKLKVEKVASTPKLKYAAAVLLSVLFCFYGDINLLDTDNAWFGSTGKVLAGLIAALGSNFIHEIVKILQMVKNLKQ